jgi:hypothetical protein
LSVFTVLLKHHPWWKHHKAHSFDNAAKTNPIGPVETDKSLRTSLQSGAWTCVCSNTLSKECSTCESAVASAQSVAGLKESLIPPSSRRDRTRPKQTKPSVTRAHQAVRAVPPTRMQGTKPLARTTRANKDVRNDADAPKPSAIRRGRNKPNHTIVASERSTQTNQPIKVCGRSIHHTKALPCTGRAYRPPESHNVSSGSKVDDKTTSDTNQG